MSHSFRTEQQTESELCLESPPAVAPYAYPASEDPAPWTWTGFASLNEDPQELLESAPNGNHPKMSGARDLEELEKERQHRFQAGRQQGIEEGRNAERETLKCHLRAAEERQRDQLGDLMMKFQAGRDRHLQELEEEVVRLALAIAARILRREVQMDPLLLTSAVRVALGQLATTTRVRLFVPAQDKDLWSEAITCMPQLTLRPEVVASEGMSAGDCRIETEMGSVDLGVRAQLNEIGRSLFDRSKRKAETNPLTSMVEAEPDADLAG